MANDALEDGRIGSYMMPAGSGFTESFSRQVSVTSTRVDAVRSSYH